MDWSKGKGILRLSGVFVQRLSDLIFLTINRSIRNIEKDLGYHPKTEKPPSKSSPMERTDEDEGGSKP